MAKSQLRRRKSFLSEDAGAGTIHRLASCNDAIHRGSRASSSQRYGELVREQRQHGANPGLLR